MGGGGEARDVVLAAPPTCSQNCRFNYFFVDVLTGCQMSLGGGGVAAESRTLKAACGDANSLRISGTSGSESARERSKRRPANCTAPKVPVPATKYSMAAEGLVSQG